MNLCPCARPRRSGGRVLVLAAAARRVPRQALAGAARSLRPRRRRCRGRGRRSSRPGPSEASAPVRERVAAARARLDGAAARGEPPRPTSCSSRAVERLPLSGRGRARVARVARTAAALAGADARAPRARRGGARLPLAEGAGGVNELALASFAAAGDAAPRRRAAQRRFAAFKARFDRARRAGAARRARLPLPRPLRPVVPGAAPRDPRSAAGSLPARRRGRRAAGAAGGRGRRRTRLLRLRRQVARSLGRELAAAGLVVVSGLARGIDAEAHRGALEAAGSTVAVLGCGIDRDYPAAHRELARQIAATGLVVSEYAPGVEPAPWRFPARNRIVAGLCAATVVVEARERSGALITADFALEEGREVLAVPGEITSALSAGANALLRLGATPLTCAAGRARELRARRRRPLRRPSSGRRPLPCSSGSGPARRRRRARARDRARAPASSRSC